MKIIPLTKGFETIVDDADFYWLNVWKWTTAGGYARRKPYAARCPRTGKIQMHRLILGLTERWIFTDHINGDTLDNRRSNLRACTPTQNNVNRPDVLVRGVIWNKREKKWRAKIGKNDREPYWLGRFDDPVEAAIAYNKAAIIRYGEFATLNDLDAAAKMRPPLVEAGKE